MQHSTVIPLLPVLIAQTSYQNITSHFPSLLHVSHRPLIKKYTNLYLHNFQYHSLALILQKHILRQGKPSWSSILVEILLCHRNESKSHTLLIPNRYQFVQLTIPPPLALVLLLTAYTP